MSFSYVNHLPGILNQGQKILTFSWTHVKWSVNCLGIRGKKQSLLPVGGIRNDFNEEVE